MPPPHPSPSQPAAASTEPQLGNQRPDASALRLGYAGLIPFVAGAALVWIVERDAHAFVGHALAAYAAVIVSFLGGIHWGFGMTGGAAADPGRFVWGIVPSLVAWFAVLMPPPAALVVLGVLLVVCYAVDRRVYPRQRAAAWLTLRFRLTAVASLSCFLGAAGSA